ncbi:DUF4272 domain-containing protein [Bremerella sp. JC817]|uniref:DUF4272 domain-containing protein n=1 Tax=Bremerella sp. JC817 TaxID=3231756 RepID=UPI003459BDA3
MLLINAYCTHRNPPEPNFPHELHSRRDRSDAELAEHLNGFVGYVMQNGQREMTQVLYHVYRHIERVQHQFSLTIDQDDFEKFAYWAEEANAILFMPDGSICDAMGYTLVDPADGSCDEEAQLPFPPDARQRKEATEQQLATLGIPTLPSLPPVVGECEVQLRSAEEVARRTLSLLVVAIRAEMLAEKQPVPQEEMRRRLPLAFESLTPDETTFMQTDMPDQQSVMNFVWRYEALFLLQWALGHFDTLPFPEEICDVPAVVRDILDRDAAEMIATAKLRPAAEILEAVDLHLRLHWATTEIRQRKQKPPSNINTSVLIERRHALNWLICFEDADWDDVSIPT